MTPRRALVILIVLSAFVRLIAAINLGLGNDEAYHFLYAAHPALSYYDHPPMMAWVVMAGLTLTGNHAYAWAVRFGFIVLFGCSTWLLAKLTSRSYGEWAGFLAALALNLTGYYGLAAATFALPDGPLLFFWLLTIDRLTVALDEPDPRRLKPWVWVGLAWGGALLSKYHALLIPLGTLLYILLDRSMRRRLYQPGPYLALAIGLLLFSPVIVWNASHGWASFLFQGSRAVGSWLPRPDYLILAILAQAAYLFPWIWIPLVVILIRGCRNWPKFGSDHERLWLCQAIVPLGIFSAVACFRPVLPHWGLIGLVSLFPILGTQLGGAARETPAADAPTACGRCRLFRGDSGHCNRRIPLWLAPTRRSRWVGTRRYANRSDARSLRMGPGGRTDSALRPDRGSRLVCFQQLLVSKRPSRPCPGRQSACRVLQRRRSARIRILEPT